MQNREQNHKGQRAWEKKMNEKRKEYEHENKSKKKYKENENS